jgi:O-antigen/teichoic acid export membrane protein
VSEGPGEVPGAGTASSAGRGSSASEASGSGAGGLLRAAGTYAAANVAARAVPFLLLPVLTRYLPPEEFGVLAMFAVVWGLAAPLVGWNVHGALGRRYFDREAVDLPGYVTSCLLVGAAGALATGVAVLAASGPLLALTGLSALWLLGAVVVAAGLFAQQVRLTLWQVAGRPLPYGAFQVAQALLQMGAALVLVVGLGEGWRGRAGAQVGVTALFALLALALLGREGWLSGRPRRAHAAHALAFGAPLLPHAYAGFVLQATDRTLLAGMEGLAAAGVYATGAQVGAVVQVLLDSLNAAWVPWLFARLKAGDAASRRRVVRFTYALFAAILAGVAAVGLAAPPALGLLLGKDYSAAGAYVFWIALGFGFEGMYKLVVNHVFFAQRTALLPWITASVAAGHVGLSVLLIRASGPLGAAQAGAASHLLAFLAVWALASRVVPMPWRAPFRGA